MHDINQGSKANSWSVPMGIALNTYLIGIIHPGISDIQKDIAYSIFIQDFDLRPLALALKFQL